MSARRRDGLRAAAPTSRAIWPPPRPESDRNRPYARRGPDVGQFLDERPGRYKRVVTVVVPEARGAVLAVGTVSSPGAFVREHSGKDPSQVHPHLRRQIRGKRAVLVPRTERTLASQELVRHDTKRIEIARARRVAGRRGRHVMLARRHAQARLGQRPNHAKARDLHGHRLDARVVSDRLHKHVTGM